MKLILNELDKKYNKKRVLMGASYTFESGKVYAVVGEKDSGKTTLLKCISGEESYKYGSIDLIDDMGEDVFDYSLVGCTYENPILPEFLTGYEFIKFFLEVNSDKITNPLSIDEYFNLVEFDIGERYRMIKTYSVELKNKLAMLSLIILNVPVMLLDRPVHTNNMSDILKVKEMISKMGDDKIIIVATKSMPVAEQLADEIVLLNGGVLVNYETFKEEQNV